MLYIQPLNTSHSWSRCFSNYWCFKLLKFSVLINTCTTNKTSKHKSYLYSLYCTESPPVVWPFMNTDLCTPCEQTSYWATSWCRGSNMILVNNNYTYSLKDVNSEKTLLHSSKLNVYFTYLKFHPLWFIKNAFKANIFLKKNF